MVHCETRKHLPKLKTCSWGENESLTSAPLARTFLAFTKVDAVFLPSIAWAQVTQFIQIHFKNCISPVKTIFVKVTLWCGIITALTPAAGWKNCPGSLLFFFFFSRQQWLLLMTFKTEKPQERIKTYLVRVGGHFHIEAETETLSGLALWNKWVKQLPVMPTSNAGFKTWPGCSISHTAPR